MKITKAIILAGGEGTRLRPLTYTTPKALLDINGKTLTEHVLDIVKKYEIKDIILSVGYLRDKVKKYFEDGSKFGVKIKFVEEETPRGTAGPFILMDKINEPIVVINGDNLFDINLEKMEKFHFENNALATLGLTHFKDISQFGSVEMEENRITAFKEKMNKKEAGWISSGYYILDPIVFDMVEGKEKAMLELDVFPKLAQQGRLFGYRSKGMWFDTGTFESYERVKKEWHFN